MKQGQAVFSGVLYFFMAMVIVALFMPVVRTFIGMGLGNLTHQNYTNPTLIGLIINYLPVAFGFVMLIVFIIIVTRR